MPTSGDSRGSIVDRIFGLNRLSTSAGDVEFQFAYKLPAWLWVGIIVACFGIAAWSYYRLLGSLKSRVSLALIRGLTLLLLALLIAQPQLVRQNERVEKDWVVVMADRSASMSVADSGATREKQLNDAMLATAPTWEKLRETRNVMLLGFDAAIKDIEFDTQSVAILGEPQGQRTLIGQSIEQVLKRLATRPIAGVVLLSDGRSPDQPSVSLMKQLEAKGVSIFAYPLGSPSAPADVALVKLDTPPGAFVGDFIPVTAQVALLTAPGADEPVKEQSVKVELLNSITGELLRTENVILRSDEPPKDVVLLTKPQGAGIMPMSVRVIGGEDLSAANNEAVTSVDVVDRPLRVLYIDGYPRWEYRYIKNLMVREQSLTSVVMLLHPNRKYIQDGTEVIDYLPRTDEEWRTFDVVVLGDVLPSIFTSEQLSQIRSLVADRGGGLLWIGGEGATPGAWRTTPLADLIPFAISQNESIANGVGSYLAPVFMRPNPAAERYGVLRLSGEEASTPWPEELVTPELRWPLLRWAQLIESSSLKPTSEVLASAWPATGLDVNSTGASDSASSSPSTPLVIAMRYGAGRVIYVGTDETWRYRYLRGETLAERFWVPLLRLLGRESLGRSGKPVVLTANPQQAQVGQPVQISARLLDQRYIESKPATLAVRIQRKELNAGSGKGPGVEVVLSLVGGGDGLLTFAGEWVPPSPGEFSLVGSDPVLAGADVSAAITAFTADDELRFPQSDHPALKKLADETGGRVLDSSTLTQLPTILPNRELRTLGTPDIETLWDKPIVFVTFILLLVIEWAWRRLIKLA